MTIDKTIRLIVNQGSYATYPIITCNQYSSAHNISTHIVSIEFKDRKRIKGKAQVPQL